MEVRIGVQWSSRELEIDMGDGADADADAVAKEIAAAIEAGGLLWLTDAKGRRVGIPAEKIAYVELETGAAGRRVGFGLSG